MKKLEKLFRNKILNSREIRGGRKWDTTIDMEDGLHRDHTCPNGNLLIGKTI